MPPRDSPPPDHPPPPDPSLFRELADGTASLPARFIVAFAAAIFYAGCAMVSAYLLAASVRAWDRRHSYGYSPYYPGVYPREGLVATVCIVAAAIWIATVVWIFLPRARRR